MQLYISWYIRSFFGLTFLNILYFFKYSCTNIFHRRSLYTFYSIIVSISDLMGGVHTSVSWVIWVWPSNAMRWHTSGSTLAQAMTCCLTEPSHYLKHCWLIISEVLWHSPEGIFTGNARGNAPDMWHSHEGNFTGNARGNAPDMWHSHESNFTGNAPDICVGYEFKK